MFVFELVERDVACTQSSEYKSCIYYQDVLRDETSPHAALNENKGASVLNHFATELLFYFLGHLQESTHHTKGSFYC